MNRRASLTPFSEENNLNTNLVLRGTGKSNRLGDDQRKEAFRFNEREELPSLGHFFARRFREEDQRQRLFQTLAELRRLVRSQA